MYCNCFFFFLLRLSKGVTLNFQKAHYCVTVNNFLFTGWFTGAFDLGTSWMRLFTYPSLGKNNPYKDSEYAMGFPRVILASHTCFTFSFVLKEAKFPYVWIKGFERCRYGRDCMYGRQDELLGVCELEVFYFSQILGR